jgi:hypothetical protein
MAKLSKEELIKKAGPTFETHGVDKLFATSDGCFFLPENERHAKSHSASYGHELFEIEKPKGTETKKKTTTKKSSKTKKES